ncbi:MAG: LuxR C-terminal-related transcriptional regulator [Planctomycetes bacterium]|jgi:two-component system response regulator FixJ|nr:LuxR C-terminal-related transcriptional regulator [Planctomycetota bacterium]
MDAHNNVVNGLLFAPGRAATVQALTALLAARGIGTRHSATLEECLDQLGVRPWRFLILDASREPHSVLDVLTQARRAHLDVPAFVLVSQGDIGTAVQMTKAGAADCLETPLAAPRLHSFVSALHEKVDRAPGNPWARLTPVEQVILQHILNGRRNRQIADLLSRSPRTVEVHRRHIMAKLGAVSVVTLVKKTIGPWNMGTLE